MPAIFKLITIVILVIVALLVLTGLVQSIVRIVPQAHAYVIQRLGTYLETPTSVFTSRFR